MAIAIMISTFGCNNGLILAGARAYYAMARDGLFFRAAGELNAREGAGVGRWCCRACGRRSSCCRGPTIRRRSTYGNLYSNLLDYVISAALIFYILTIAGVFRLRQTRPDAERPYRAFGYPVVPALYIVGAATILRGAVRLSAGDDVARAGHRAAGRAGVFRVAARRDRATSRPTRLDRRASRPRSARLANHGRGRLGDAVARQRVDAATHSAASASDAPHRIAARRAADEVDDHEVMFHAAVRRRA